MPTPFVQTDIGFTAEQAAGSRLDYGLDWSDWLALAAGDGIQSSTWTCDDPSITLEGATISGSTTVIWVTGGTAGEWYELQNTVQSSAGRRDTRVCLMHIKPAVGAGSALFPSRMVAIAKLRRDRLMLLANSLLPDLQLSDDFLWEKLLAAEAAVGHRLRVPLAPTRFFSSQPSQQQIDALNGARWAIDPPYDYSPSDWHGDKWGFILTRQKPIQSIVGLRLAYPSPSQTIVEVPTEWLRCDRKYGHVQIVPTGHTFQTMLGGMFMSQISGGRTLPFTVHLEYVAGLANVPRDFPDLLDVVQKMAVTKIVEDGFLPQSGSISADGLSQSMSVDVSKYNDSIDRLIDGEGGNGGLVASIHGIKTMVI